MKEKYYALQSPEVSINTTLCVNCQTNVYEPGNPINLCTDCRSILIRYPIPNWIKFFALGLAAVIVISLIRTQMYISAAIHLGKAENAIEKRQYVTAQKELSKVLEKFPDYMDANANMLIASAYNFDYKAYGQSYDHITEKKSEDNDLINRVNTASEFLGQIFPKDTLMMKRIVEVSNDKQKLFNLIDSVDEPGLKMHIANYLYDMKEYTDVDHLTQDVLKVDSNFYAALSLMSALKRNTGKYDEALKYCDKMLQMNAEDVYAISQKARIELKRKHDDAAALYVKRAMEINPDNDSVIEAKAMVDYFKGKKKESYASLSKIKAHESLTGDSTISKRLTAIISGSEVYR